MSLRATWTFTDLYYSFKNVFAMVGASVGSYPADRIGRRWMIHVVRIIMVGGSILEQLSSHWTHWLGARFLDVQSSPPVISLPLRGTLADSQQGLSVGLAQCCINVYISEMAPTAYRGSLMSLVQLNVS